MHLTDLIPDIDVLVALEPEELGLHILQVLAVRSPRADPFQLSVFLSSALAGYGGSPKREEASQAMREAWAWLEGQAFLIRDLRFRGGEMCILSRKARRLAQEPKARRAFSGYRLPKETLHPSIREDVWSLYHRGKYDTAVFEAMKSVEVAVRHAAGLEARWIGTDLMRKAFAVENGALTDKAAERGEREALSHLFAGAIGTYKNAHSHRNVALEDPNEAAEIILLANHLLRIVDGRKKTSGGS